MPITSLSRSEWNRQRQQHQQRVQPWTHDRVTRSLRSEKHPIYDFLFEYYSFRPAHLERYSPGINILLQEAKQEELDWPKLFTVETKGASLLPSAFSLHRLPTVRWGIRFLQATLDRPPVFHCFGLHEWAMVYRAEQVRHSTPLRLSPEEIAAFVESQRLACTHFDAFRFFTPGAVPRNRFQLTRYGVNEFDQAGCIHANMDLYKWAFHLAPFTTSKLIADTFELARQAREIDMRASPYDLSALGFAPILIETKAGRDEYLHYQRDICDKSQPLRYRVLLEYQTIERLVTDCIPEPLAAEEACISLILS